MLVLRAGIHKMLVRIANREDPDQTAEQSDLGLPCLSRHFGRKILFEILEKITVAYFEIPLIIQQNIYRYCYLCVTENLHI